MTHKSDVALTKLSIRYLKSDDTFEVESWHGTFLLILEYLAHWEVLADQDVYPKIPVKIATISHTFTIS